jgi:hypothetical protein
MWALSEVGPLRAAFFPLPPSSPVQGGGVDSESTAQSVGGNHYYFTILLPPGFLVCMMNAY